MLAIHTGPLELPDEVRAGKAKQIKRTVDRLHLLFTKSVESLLTNFLQRALQVAGLNGYPRLPGRCFIARLNGSPDSSCGGSGARRNDIGAAKPLGS
jgi:hypothetical protein